MASTSSQPRRRPRGHDPELLVKLLDHHHGNPVAAAHDLLHISRPDEKATVDNAISELARTRQVLSGNGPAREVHPAEIEAGYYGDNSGIDYSD